MVFTLKKSLPSTLVLLSLLCAISNASSYEATEKIKEELFSHGYHADVLPAIPMEVTF